MVDPLAKTRLAEPVEALSCLDANASGQGQPFDTLRETEFSR